MLVSGSMIECICRDQDEEVSRILEEKQRLIAEILQESVQNYSGYCVAPSGLSLNLAFYSSTCQANLQAGPKVNKL